MLVRGAIYVCMRRHLLSLAASIAGTYFFAWAVWACGLGEPLWLTGPTTLFASIACVLSAISVLATVETMISEVENDG